ncbi:hypothetical protein A4X09_0g7817, partial [Tilletia walkeri]
CWEHRQLNVIHRATRPDKARHLGYKAKQGFVIYRIRVLRGNRKKPVPKGATFGKPVRQGVSQLKPQRSPCSTAEERVGRKCGNLRVLNSYWINSDGVYKVLCVDPSHKAIRPDARINWIVKRKHHEAPSLTGAGQKSRGMGKVKGRTDHYARKRLISQAKNKYAVPKYRLFVRFSKRFFTVQVVHAKIVGDIVLTQGPSRELPRYGIKYGLSYWPAAYVTGLLAARRALTKLNKYEGVTEPDGAMAEVEAHEGDDEPRPFKCYLDVGPRRISTGSRVFGALKGASDGGI